jgi:hypothetical protein
MDASIPHDEEQDQLTSTSLVDRLLEMSVEELKEEKKKREKTPALFHWTGINVVHSQLVKRGSLSAIGGKLRGL